MIKIFKRLSIYFSIATLSLITNVAKAQTDASITGIDPTNRLTAWPVYLADTVSFAGKCSNAGVDTINNLKVTVEIYDNTATLIYIDSVIYNTVEPAANINYNVGHFFTKVLGVYSVKGYVTTEGVTDINGANDTAFATFAVTDSTMAHDYLAFTGIDGTYTVNSGNALAKMGNLFTISKTVNLTSVYFKLQNPIFVGDTVRATIYTVDALGKPTTTSIAQTVIYTFTANDVANGVDLVLPVESNTVLLPATYMVAVNEYGGSINLATTNRIYTPLTSFYMWPPLSQTVWQPIEIDNIFQTYVIEPNFGCKLEATGVASDEICNNQNGTITAQALFSSGNVSYLWSTGATTQTISNLSGGSYSLTIMDEAGCSAFAVFNLNNVAGPTIDSSATTGTNCFGSSDGGAQVFASGGTGSLIYVWSNGDTNAAIIDQIAGNYTATVTDQNGCFNQTTVSIVEPTQVVVTPTSTGTLCNGSSDGTIDAAVVGGTGAYSYLWSTGDTDATVLNLIAGTYSVTVTDANGCSATKSVDVSQPTAIQITPTVNDALCFGSSTGSVSVVVSGGTGNLNFLWDDSSTDATIINQPAGTYTVLVTDDNSCTTSSVSVINEPTAIVILMNVTNTFCSSSSDGSVSALVSGGTSSYTYLWSNGVTIADNNNLPTGTYTVLITDANGCTATRAATVTTPNPIVISTTTLTDASCFGSSDGNATITASGGTGSFNYIWSTGDTNDSISNQPAGTYTVTATDQNGCTTSSDIVINEPTKVDMTTSFTNTSCNGGNDGTVGATGNGGTPAYTYLWSTGDTDADVINLSIGTYSVTVTDAHGCSTTQSVVVGQPTTIQITPTIVDASCFGTSTGSINVSAVGGTGSLNYYWSDGSTDAAITNQPAGTYTIIVTDQNSCVEALTLVINEPNELAISLTPNSTFCSSSTDGSVTTVVSGGTSPYLYSWSNGSTDADNINLTVGTYTVLVTDAQGCSVTNQATVTTPNPIVISLLSVTNTTCFGGSNGNATVTASGGTGTISYLWSTGSVNLFITNQPAGTYTITATDQNGCSSSSNVVINQPTQIDITTSFTNTSCFGGNDGTVGAVASGGTPGYSYLWSTGDTDVTVSNLVAATYFITVTDANGCTNSKSVDVEQPGQIIITPLVTNITCHGNTDGTIDISSFGGIGTVNYLWSNGETTTTISNLLAGVYTVTATDQNGCTSTITASIVDPAQLVAFTSALDVSCFGGNNGAVYALVSGGTGNMSYLWSNGSTVAANTNVGIGTYTVLVNDANNCTATATAVVTQPTQLQATTASTADNGTNSGTATVSSATGGVAPYGYSWNTVPVQTNITATGLAAATYTVTITDANQCTLTATVIVASSAGINENIDVTDFSVTPNPARDMVFVNVKLVHQSDVQIHIADATGKIVYNEVMKNALIINKKISVDTFSKGIYSLSIQTQGGIETKRIVIE